MGGGGPGHKILRELHFFLIEKYIADARQDEKHVPDLLEAIIQPPGLVKEELRPILMKLTQIISKITRIRVSILKGFARCRQSLKLYCNKTY